MSEKPSLEVSEFKLDKAGRTILKEGEEAPITIDVDLPNPQTDYSLYIYFGLFVLGCAVLGTGIVNYDNINSNVVNASMFALRRSPIARDLLGPQIRLKGVFPWLWGSLNMLRGDVHFKLPVMGQNDNGILRFRAVREHPDSDFELVEWSLEVSGNIYDLRADNGITPVI